MITMKQTRKDIQATFIKLASIKPVDKITVKEIVDECGLNRNSFYYHFEDMSGLIESIIEDIFSKKYWPEFGSNPKESLMKMAEDLQKHKYLCANIYNSKEKDYLDIRLSRLTQAMVSSFLEQEQFSRYSISDADRRLIIGIYQAEIFGLIHQWMNDNSGSLIDRFARLYDLREGTMRRMLERADQTGKSNS